MYKPLPSSQCDRHVAACAPVASSGSAAAVDLQTHELTGGGGCVRARAVAVGNCCGPTAEQKAAAAADEEAQRKEARAKAAAAAEARLEQNSSRGITKGSSKK